MVQFTKSTSRGPSRAIWTNVGVSLCSAQILISITLKTKVYIYKSRLGSSRTCIHRYLYYRVFFRGFTSGDASGTRLPSTLISEKIDVSTQTTRQEWWTSLHVKIHIQKTAVKSFRQPCQYGKVGVPVPDKLLKLAHFHNLWFKNQFSHFLCPGYSCLRWE